MSLPHFFLEQQVIAHENHDTFVLDLSSEDAKHAKVLRLGAGEHIGIVDAHQDYFEVEIVSFDNEGIRVRIAQHLDAPSHLPHVVLFQGLAKGDKMDSVIRHATELGVSAFVPLACKRSVLKIDKKRAANKVQRWRAIAKSAAMQSGQVRVPEVSEPHSITEALPLLSGLSAVLICWEEAPGTASLSQALRAAVDAPCHDGEPIATIGVVVGPEGGLDAGEVETLLSSNRAASLVSLGPSILRTETAGIVAPALVLYELGALGGARPGDSGKSVFHPSGYDEESR